MTLKLIKSNYWYDKRLEIKANLHLLNDQRQSNRCISQSRIIQSRRAKNFKLWKMDLQNRNKEIEDLLKENQKQGKKLCTSKWIWGTCLEELWDEVEKNENPGTFCLVMLRRQMKSLYGIIVVLMMECC